ncbi:zinc-ribbon and DUF3426 domain-containing protein [Comamonas composti]|uniref:zinc-ribbon and DUF3426 domain-containing protein n=1 Tax=Comamonas composti TaxID=408558 RepID=UPI0003F769DA|nr:zinc-ribbon and DUF3426 domain-containing protein [Comamonas composti]
MSQVTSCPACGTSFKVVADQLRISQGWVRCGMCNEVFDALQSLSQLPSQDEEASSETLPAPADAGGNADAPPPGLQLQQVDQVSEGYELPGASSDDGHAELRPQAVESEAVLHELEPQVSGREAPATVSAESLSEPSEPADSQEDEEAAHAAPDPAGIVSQDLAKQTIRPDAFPAPSATEERQAESDEQKPEQKEHAESEAQAEPEPLPWPDSDARHICALPEVEPGFVREARRKAFWARPAVRVLLGLASLMAAGLLAAQMLWQQRDELAARYPNLQPALEMLCAKAGCELQPRQGIADVVIDSSGFRQIAAGRYEWSVTLENRSGAAVAMPALELTLTDAQDRPLVRRVVRLEQLGAPALIQANSEWSLNTIVEVREPELSVAGYRTLVFYP